MKKSFLLLIILFALKGYSQSYEISGVVGDNRKMSPDEILLSDDKCEFSILYNGSNITLPYSKWAIKLELSDKSDEEYAIIYDSDENIFKFYIDAVFDKSSGRFERYEIDKSVMYKGRIDFEGRSETGEEINCSFPVMLNLLPSIPEVKIVDVYWGVYDEECRCYEEAYMIVEINADRLTRVLGEGAYPGIIGYTFYLDMDSDTNQAKVDFFYDDSHFIFRACNSNGAVACKDTIYIKDLELAASMDGQTMTKEKMKFYPNPVKDILYIQKVSDYHNPIYIYSLNGTLVRYFNSVNTSIDLSDLSSGIYLLEYTSDNKKKEFIKLIKK